MKKWFQVLQILHHIKVDRCVQENKEHIETTQMHQKKHMVQQFTSQYSAELELWFMNPESVSWSHELKFSKTYIFHELLFPVYDNFKIINTDDIYLSRVTWVRFNDERIKFCKLL